MSIVTVEWAPYTFFLMATPTLGVDVTLKHLHPLIHIMLNFPLVPEMANYSREDILAFEPFAVVDLVEGGLKFLEGHSEETVFPGIMGKVLLPVYLEHKDKSL